MATERGYRGDALKYGSRRARGDWRHVAGGGHRSDHRALGKDRRFGKRVDRRLSKQRARTRDGWRRGEITHRELKRIRKDRRKIVRMERRFGRDGRYTRHERRKLNKAMDRASKRIYRAKHNNRIADAGRPRANRH